MCQGTAYFGARVARPNSSETEELGHGFKQDTWLGQKAADGFLFIISSLMIQRSQQ